MSQEAEKAVQAHITGMGLPESTGRQILEARQVVEAYLKNQAEIAKISIEAETSKQKIQLEIEESDKGFRRRQNELDDERNRKHNELYNMFNTVDYETKESLKPLWERANEVKRIIALLQTAETIQPVKDIEDSDITTFHGEYLEWLGRLYKGDYLIIRLLITENRKPKNKYSLLAYGRCAFDDKILLNRKQVYTYGTPNLDEHREIFSIRLELGSFPSIPDAKTYAQKNSNKPLKQFIEDYVKLKEEYLEVTANYKLSDFEQITAEEEARENARERLK